MSCYQCPVLHPFPQASQPRHRVWCHPQSSVPISSLGTLLVTDLNLEILIYQYISCIGNTFLFLTLRFFTEMPWFLTEMKSAIYLLQISSISDHISVQILLILAYVEAECWWLLIKIYLKWKLHNIIEKFCCLDWDRTQRKLKLRFSEIV